MERNGELLAALIVIVLLTAVYVPIAWLGAPRPGSLIGHTIGIVGFVLMIATETLYSLRKRSWRMARWGSMQSWLSAHIFMGIVGPYMVFLHTGWHFAGLAGVTVLLTAVVVASGFIGRYIYTAVPRTSEGAMIEVAQLEATIERTEAQLHAWLSSQPARLRALANRMSAPPALEEGGVWGILGRPLAEWQYRGHWRREVARLDQETRRQTAALQELVKRRRTLQRQMRSQQMARRLMALWHAIHVPLGMALFAAALLHIIGALYYS